MALAARDRSLGRPARHAWRRLPLLRGLLFAEGQRTVAAYNAPGPPRLSEVEAVERSAAMVERVHRMYQRTLRALQDVRRPAVLVRRAGQVNIAQ
jgi:hypothetical protein